MWIDDNLGRGTAAVLRKAGLETADSIVKLGSRDALARIKGMGVRRIDEVEQALVPLTWDGDPWKLGRSYKNKRKPALNQVAPPVGVAPQNAAPAAAIMDLERRGRAEHLLDTGVKVDMPGYAWVGIKPVLRSPMAPKAMAAITRLENEAIRAWNTEHQEAKVFAVSELPPENRSRIQRETVLILIGGGGEGGLSYRDRVTVDFSAPEDEVREAMRQLSALTEELAGTESPVPPSVWDDLVTAAYLLARVPAEVLARKKKDSAVGLLSALEQLGGELGGEKGRSLARLLANGTSSKRT